MRAVLPLLAAVAFLAAPARPYVLWGTSLSPTTHPFYIDPSLPISCNGTVADQVGAILLAAQEWNVHGGADFRFVFAGFETFPYAPGTSVLTFGTSCVGYPMANGLFVTCMFPDVPFDVSGSPPLFTFDLQGSSVHQLGHALGLGHTTVPGCSMYTQSVNALEFRTIETDDIYGIQAIYGPLPSGVPALDYVGLPYVGQTIAVRLVNVAGPSVIGFDTVPGPTVVPGIGTVELGLSPSVVLVPVLAPTTLFLPLPADPGLIGTTYYMHAVTLTGTSIVLSNPYRLAIPY
ncbi:MAG TPA: matrixin family metalloprotease [Planctomycetota bacterium]|jgi:hypothetical protein|nr:matrixin family metalloprotease [Planctomycetota bacterium]